MNTTADLLLHGWEVHPTVVAGCLALIAWHLAAAPRLVKYAAPFLLGVLILCLALISPIDPLGDAYLFSAHMLQHLLLILIVPPLLILGLCSPACRWLDVTSPDAAGGVCARPPRGGLVFQHADDGHLASAGAL